MGWMDGNREVERSREMLMRIIALLLSLAGLAERVSVAPNPVRLFVLGVLRRAEAVAREFVIGMAHDFGAPTPARSHETLAAKALRDPDAAHLARSFRELALMLDHMLAQTYRFRRYASRITAAVQSRGGRNCARSGGLIGCIRAWFHPNALANAAVGYPDTS